MSESRTAVARNEHERQPALSSAVRPPTQLDTATRAKQSLARFHNSKAAAAVAIKKYSRLCKDPMALAQWNTIEASFEQAEQELLQSYRALEIDPLSSHMSPQQFEPIKIEIEKFIRCCDDAVTYIDRQVAFLNSITVDMEKRAERMRSLNRELLEAHRANFELAWTKIKKCDSEKQRQAFAQVHNALAACVACFHELSEKEKAVHLEYVEGKIKAHNEWIKDYPKSVHPEAVKLHLSPSGKASA